MRDGGEPCTWQEQSGTAASEYQQWNIWLKLQSESMKFLNTLSQSVTNKTIYLSI